MRRRALSPASSEPIEVELDRIYQINRIRFCDALKRFGALRFAVKLARWRAILTFVAAAVREFPARLLPPAASSRAGEARELSDLEQQGLIQAFEFMHELA
jgi:hypothetical protein